MVRDLMNVLLHRRSPDCRDAARFKTLQLVGPLVHQIVTKALHHLRSHIEGTMLSLMPHLYEDPEAPDLGEAIKRLVVKVVEPARLTAHLL
jgi:DNA-directed RNA polymerase beta subunit